MKTVQAFTQPVVGGQVSIWVDHLDIGFCTNSNVHILGIGIYVVNYINPLTYEVGLTLVRAVSPWGSVISPGTSITYEGPSTVTRVSSPTISSMDGNFTVGSLVDVHQKDIEEMKKQLEELRAKLRDPVVEATSDKGPRRKDHPPWMARALGAQAMQELFENLDNLQGLELLDKANQAAALYYEEDPTVAGLVTAALSCFEGEDKLYYASIVRYSKPNGIGKEIVGCGQEPTLEGAIRSAVRNWIETLRTKKKAQPVQTTPTDEDEEDTELAKKLRESVQKLKEQYTVPIYDDSGGVKWGSLRSGDVIGGEVGIDSMGKIIGGDQITGIIATGPKVKID